MRALTYTHACFSGWYFAWNSLPEPDIKRQSFLLGKIHGIPPSSYFSEFLNYFLIFRSSWGYVIVCPFKNGCPIFWCRRNTPHYLRSARNKRRVWNKFIWRGKLICVQFVYNYLNKKGFICQLGILTFIFSFFDHSALRKYITW